MPARIALFRRLLADLSPAVRGARNERHAPDGTPRSSLTAFARSSPTALRYAVRAGRRGRRVENFYPRIDCRRSQANRVVPSAWLANRPGAILLQGIHPMFCHNQSMKSFHAGRRVAACLLALAATASLAAPLQAQMIDASFSVTISEKEMALAEPGDMMMMKYLMWDLSFQRMTARSMPYVELRNDDTSDAPITELRMTIGDTKFHFNCEFLGECAMLGKSTPDINITSLTEDNGDTLVVQFPDGLDAGDVARFKIDLDVDSQYAGQIFPNPDFRTVLFDMNGRNVYLNDADGQSTGDNAKVTAKYDLPEMPTLVSQPIPFEDEIIGGAPSLYYNDIYRPYGVMEAVDSFQLLGSASAVPEPSGMVLSAFGLLGGMLPLVRRARRRS
jgi:hypothetical protein